ncbi:hypothetical protein XELAEV_18030670mg [Xenopus laevis]|uniref:Uncharacterized protein n=1 Tax=Xenopus laevis TaxID=8355 RepID=A0A974CL65_XENLA|nr:hypothetical protein XELAEV_18030670mg [Xenopus laevis]
MMGSGGRWKCYKKCRWIKKGELMGERWGRWWRECNGCSEWVGGIEKVRNEIGCRGVEYGEYQGQVQRRSNILVHFHLAKSDESTMVK